MSRGRPPREFAVFPGNCRQLTVTRVQRFRSFPAGEERRHQEEFHRDVCLHIAGAAHFFMSLSCRTRMHKIIIARSLNNQITIQAAFNPRKRVIDQVEMTGAS